MVRLENLDPEVIFFLGAGASVKAGISGVQFMVTDFLEKLKEEYNNSLFEIANDIFTVLLGWKGEREEVAVDIELMLETIERLENKQLEVMPFFCDQKKEVLKKFDNLDKGMPKLSSILKQFIKLETGKSDIQIDYLGGLLKFMKTFKPFHVFSTNYDICIERLCEMNNREYFDGFFGKKWDPTRFSKTDPYRDLNLYKLHGSVTWWRDERGRYTSNEISMIDAKEPLRNIVTRELEVPLISYPGRKLEYFEPIFDLIDQLKNRLNNPNLKYIFAVGYSFRDDHIRRIVQYASEINRQFILFLISPSAHQIYQNNLQSYKDMDIVHSFTYTSFTEKSFNKARPSSLVGRVICLPYKFEEITDSLYDVYLAELKKGIELEVIESGKTEPQVAGWEECVKHFIDCEYFDKVNYIIEKRMGGLDRLMQDDPNLYELGWKIIIKLLLNTLFLDNEREQWSQNFKKYLTVLANNVESKLLDQTDSLYLEFKYSQNRPIKLGSEIHGLFKRLSKIHDSHPIFSNDNASGKTNLAGIKIREVVDYFSTWQNNNVSLPDYIGLREVKYPEFIIPVKNFAEGTSLDKSGCISAVSEIEREIRDLSELSLTILNNMGNTSDFMIELDKR
jgi:hypothetical protein